MRKLFLTLFATAAVASFAAESAVGFQWYKTIGIDAEKRQSNVDAAEADASVEYFNLQGMRVANPQAGTLVIRRQGDKVSKLIVR